MKRFIYKLFPFFILLVTIIFVIPITIDPFNVFHYKKIRDNGIEPNKHYIKMRYILENPAKFDSFLFGSSRVALIDIGLFNNMNCYNMNYSEGVPAEHLRNLQTMIENEIIPVNVILGIDNISCFVDPKMHEETLFRIPPPSLPGNTMFIMKQLAYLKFFLKYCDYSTIFPSLKIIISHKTNKEQQQKSREQFYNNGGLPRDNDLSENKDYWENAQPAWADYYSNRINESLLDIRNIIELCRKKNIKLIIFTNPIHITTYLRSRENGYLDFLYELSEITEYYNFSGINDVTINKYNYFETSHYTHEVGDMIANIIFNNKTDDRLLSQGFGYYVTLHNRDAFFEILKSQKQ
jgi:hypothetical protein